MQQGLTDTFLDNIWRKFPLKINARKSRLKVTYQELMEVKNIPLRGMPTW
jgi:hypothetical protein